MQQLIDAGSLLLEPAHPLVAGRTGRGVAIAVIDSGVHPRHPHIRLERIGRLMAVDPDGSEHSDAVDRLGHGTAVAAAIQEKAPDAELHVIRVFQDRLSTTATALVRAIDLAAGLGAGLINLSLGTTQPDHAPALAAAVARAAAAGAIIVAPLRAGGLPSYPGSLPCVAGVELDNSGPRNAVRLCDGVYHGSGYARPIPGVPPDRNLNGVSFAVANVTGTLACVLQTD
jgi:subtilisin family serine protease